jgi:hypothetical protein
MWALGFLLAFVIFSIAIHLLTKLLPSKVRSYVWLLVAGTVISFPFWHYLYPSYWDFQSLCERTDRYSVMRTIEVKNIYVNSSPFSAYALSTRRGFIGFEMREGEFANVRYVRNDNWTSDACQAACANPSISIWEKECEPTCLTKSYIERPEFGYTVTFAHIWLINDRLQRDRQAAVDLAGRELAVALNYRYFPYGNGLAKILGLSSGDAPTKSCPSKVDIWNYDFLKPASTNR